jgi:hypothetical protein
MSDPQQTWCQPGDRKRRQFIVMFDDADKEMAVFDGEVEARTFWKQTSLEWNCYLFGALPRGDLPEGDGEVLEHLEKVAEGQKEYFENRQREFPCLDDFFDDEGYLQMPEEPGPLLQQNHYNGRYSEADWWLQTIRALKARWSEKRSS